MEKEKEEVELTKETKKKQFLQRARQIPDQVETLIEEFGYQKCTVYQYLREEGIYHKKAIISLLDEKTNEQIAEEGKVAIEAVARIRKEVEEQEQSKKNEEQKAEEEKKENEKKREKERDKKVEEVLSLAAQGKTVDEIEKVIPWSRSHIYAILQENHVFSRKKIVLMLDKMSDEEIAREGKINIDVVAKIRQEEKNKAKRIQQFQREQQKQKEEKEQKEKEKREKREKEQKEKEQKEKRRKEQEEKKQRKQKNKKSNENNKMMQFLIMAKYFYSISHIMAKANMSENEVRLELKRRKIASREEVERMLELKPHLSDEVIARTSKRK